MSRLNASIEALSYVGWLLCNVVVNIQLFISIAMYPLIKLTKTIRGIKYQPSKQLTAPSTTFNVGINRKLYPNPNPNPELCAQKQQTKSRNTQ